MQRRMLTTLLFLLPTIAWAQEATSPAPISDLPTLPQQEAAQPAAAAAAAPAPEAAPATPEAPPQAPAEGPGESLPSANAAVSDAPLSFGDFPFSLMMTPAQSAALKEALTGYEHRLAQPVEEEMVVDTTPKVEPEAPTVYPVFTLGSVAFRNSSDWTVWLNGVRITPTTNTQEVKVAAIGPQMVRFAWSPPYIAALRERYKLDRFADTKPVAHKLTNPNSTMFDVPAGVVYFALRANQSFAAGYMATFEGRVASPALEKLVDETAPAAVEATATGGADAATAEPTAASGDGLSSEQEKNMEGLGSDTIRRLYQKANGADTGVTDESKNVQGTVDELLKNQQQFNDVTPKRK